jgi:Ca-activated chloride channel family protein
LRRHLPATLLLLGLCAMIFAVARPQAIITLPSRVDTIILAMDISGSMRATDVKPNRLAAAQNAAKTFIEDQPGHVRIGVVSIAAAAAVVQSPTDNRKDIFQSIDRFQLQRGTALGSGLAISLATLLPDAGIEAGPRTGGRSARPRAEHSARKAAPVAPGANSSAAIVLLSDGHSNTGPDPLQVAATAAEHGVRIFTVGVGTLEGATLTTDGMSMRVRLDEEALKKIATKTDGEYFRAGNAVDLKRIYGHLSARLTNENRRLTEVSAVFAAIGAVLAMLSALLSLAWFNRIL